MTITHRSTSTAANPAAATAITISTPAGAAAGDLLVAQVAVTNATATVSAPAGWVSHGFAQSASTSSGRKVYVFTLRLTAAPAASHVFTANASRQLVGAITAWVGTAEVESAGFFAGQTNASSLNIAAPSASPDYAPSALLLVAALTSGGGAVNPPTEFTELVEVTSAVGTNDVGTYLAWAPLTATGATGTRTATQAVAQPSGGAVLILKDAEAVTPNRAPVANAGADQWVTSGTAVTLSAAATTDPDTGNTVSVQWSQIAGTPVALSSSTASAPTFTAPPVNGALIFQVTATDGAGLSSTDTVSITVKHPPVGYSRLAGGWVPIFTS